MNLFGKISVKFFTDQRGITGLETAIVLIAFVVVAAVFAFTVLTTGLFTSEETKQASEAAIKSTEATLKKIGPFISGGACDPTLTGERENGACVQRSYMVDWTGCPGRDESDYPVDGGAGCDAHPQLFRFKLTPAGEVPVEFDPTKIVITWFDTGSGKSNDPPVYGELTLDKEIVVPAGIDLNGNPICEAESFWCYQWQAGETDEILDPGEHVEIYITGVEGFLHMVERNSKILVEVITPDGGTLKIQGLMPGVVRQTMNLDR